MELLAIFFILILAVGGGAWGMIEYMRYTQPMREQALRSELEALQAAQRLSLAAWQARQHMAEVIHGEIIDES